MIKFNCLFIAVVFLLIAACGKIENETKYEFEGTYQYTLGYPERPLIKITKNIERAREIADTTLLDSLVISYDAISLTKRTGTIRFNFRKTYYDEIPFQLAIDLPRTPIKILSYETE
jgi:hypothetical protein